MTKKKLKKISKIVVAFTIVLAMVLAYLSPLANVIAETDESEYHVNVGLNTGDFTVDLVKVNDVTWHSNQDDFVTEDNNYVIKIWVLKNGDSYPRISYCGGDCGKHYHVSVELAGNGNEFIFTVTVTNPDGTYIDMSIVEGPPITASGDIGGGNDEEEEPRFDGKAYVVWSCGDGVCYHYFDNIPDFTDGNSTFYSETEVTADNKAGVHFDVHAEHRDWILKNDFDRWVNAYKRINNTDEVDWDHLDPMDIIGEPPHMEDWEQAAVDSGACTRPGEGSSGPERVAFQNCVDEYFDTHSDSLPFVKLKPVNEPQYDNAYVSYGDRNFKVVIYNSEYKGIAMGDLSQLHYYPADWTNPFVKRDQFDISATTKEHPSGVDSILLESTVMIKPLNINGFAIASMEALDVPEDAVTITKVNGEYKLEFSSNFYDNVVFKVTDTDGEESYVLVKRYTIDGYIKFIDNHPVLNAEFYFDRTKSYTDFDLTAKIVYRDGTIKNVKLVAEGNIDDGLGNLDAEDVFEVDQEFPTEGGLPNPNGGKGLKKSEFRYHLEDGEDRNISKIYLNAEYKGSTAENYAGAYVGSGEGVLANLGGGE